MSRPSVKLTVTFLLGFCICLATYPYVVRAWKYFSLRGYTKIGEYSLQHTQAGGVPNFALIDAQGNGHELYRNKDAKAIVIITHGNDCNLVRKYGYSLVNLKKEYETRKVRFFMLNANLEDSKEKILVHTRFIPVSIPVLIDPSQMIARELGFTKVMEVVLIDPKTWQILYRGPIDNRPPEGEQKTDAEVTYLRYALEDFLHDRPIRAMNGESAGCEIKYKQSPHAVTYTEDIAPIFKKNCVYCHTQIRGTKPFLDNYQSLRGWASMILETVLTRRMPPWGWDMTLPQPFLFTDKVALNGDEIRTITEWVKAGAPRGEGKDPLKLWKHALKVKNHIPPPDYQASNQEIDVPPKGYNEYKFYQIDGPTKEDMWVVGTSLQSTNLPTIHHQMLIVTQKPLAHYRAQIAERRDEGLVNEDDDGGVPAWDLHQMRSDNYGNDKFIRIQLMGLGMAQPSFFGAVWGNKLGFFIPKNSHIILETHYHGTGKPEKEISTVGFYLHKGDKPPIHINSGLVSFTNYIEVPPGGRNIKIAGDPVILERESGLLVLGIHMHMRGNNAKYIATYPDGREEVIASHPFFNYTTSTARGLAYTDKKIFPAGTNIRIECYYDNTAANPFNPDPSKAVSWGQTIDRSEMCMGYLWTYPTGKDKPNAWNSRVSAQDAQDAKR